MKKKRLIWHIYPSYVLLAVLAMAAVLISVSGIARSFHYARTDQQLVSASHLIAEQFVAQPELLDGPAGDALCKSLAQRSGYRITLMLPDGTVIGDSEKDPATLDNHGDRREILDALSQGIGRSRRYSDTLKQEMMYVAIPITIAGEHRGTVRTSLSLDLINETTARMWRQFFWDGLLIALVAVVAALWISRRISHPLERIRQSAVSLDWEHSNERLPSSDISEVDTLTRTLNTMMDQLKKRVHTIQQQHDEQSALLSCMTECMLAVDAEKKLIKMNRSAEALFRINARASLGKNIMEVIRNADLLNLVNRTFASNTSQENEIFLAETHTYLLGSGSVLHAPGGQRMGAVIVLNDITRLRKMEHIQRDFVADVSHELRTPITSILGFAETLRYGTVESNEEKDHFLDIICRQSNRLQAIVEDLLALSSIEDEAEKGEIELRTGHVAAVIRGAVQGCQAAAEHKQVQLEISCPERLQTLMNLQLLQQAVMNLIGNAIKFSEPESRVEIVGRETEEGIAIEVRDQGPGIAPEHHARLFERFYRVDKGRSRRLGGTGLGLAIVKHIALAHRGRVGVNSEYGKGSTFFIVLPKA
jgi:two-component system phosphate regulon sensor histidine kinase PhoR